MSFHPSNLVKLTRDNHMIWRTQIVPYLEGNDLYDYVTGDVPCPPKFINSVATNSSPSVSIPNPAYKVWYQQDKLILGAIVSTLTEAILPHVYGIKTSREVWNLLEKLFASESKARNLQIRFQIATMKKNNLSISDYFQKAQNLSHTLAAIDQPMKESELTLHILAGLSAEYDSLVTSITTRVEPVSLEDLYAHLLTYEQRLEQNHMTTDLAVSSVNVAQRQGSSNNFSKQQRNFPPNNYTSGRRGRGPPQFFHNASSTSQRPTCQLCHKPGHTASTCFHRFDHAYECVPSPPSAFHITSSSPSQDMNWYPDTAATHHLTNDLSNLNMQSEEYTGNEQIRVGNGQGLDILHSGLASLPTAKKIFSLKSLLHVPDIQKNLISVNQFTRDNNVSIEFHPFDFRVKDLCTGTLLLKGPSKNGLYPWPSSSSISSPPTAFMGERVSVDSWHRRLGHPALRIVQQVISKHSIPVLSNKSSDVCSACQQGKMHRLHFGSTSSVSNSPLNLLFLDVWGPAPLLSINNKRYYLSIVDDFSRYSWLFPMTLKSDALSIFLKFQTLVENYFETTIKSVQTDGGGEFLPLQRHLSKSGISYRQTCPHTHHQNGSVERKHRHIVDTGLSLLSHSKVPFKFWDAAFDTATYLINRLPSPVTQNKSPFEILFDKTPDYKFLKVFGCECFPYLRPYNKNKFSFRSKSCVFLGYSKPHTGYKCFDLDSGKTIIARHVVFNENLFPFSSLTGSAPSTKYLPVVNPKIPQSQDDHIASAAHDVSSPVAPPAENFPACQQALSHSTVACFPFHPPSSRDFSEIQRSPHAVSPATRPPTNENALSHSSLIPNSHEFPEFPRNSRESSTESSRQNSTLQISSPSDSMPIDTSDQAYDTVPQTETYNQSLQQDNTLAQATDTTQQQHVPSPPLRTHGMLTRSQNHISKPKIPTDGTIKYPLPHALTASLTTTTIEPTCFTSAVKDAVWRDAMTAEFNALIQNGTWKLVSSTPSINIVGSKWVFRIKRKADGSIDRYKARLVAKGYHQQPGVDFTETYSPVIKPITIRAVLSLAVSAGWVMKQIDVSNAFLHGNLTETVYMSQPPGFVHPQFPTAVCELKKAIYGLKQAPRAWFSRLSTRLLDLGFVSSKSDSSLFIYKSSGITLLALVYVDDIILTGSDSTSIDRLIKVLSEDFPIKELGNLNFFLGIEVTQIPDGIHLSQQRYISDILQRTNMDLSKPITSPMAASSPLSKYSGVSLTDPTTYRSTVGALQYLSITRPDISFAVNKVSQFMHNPRDTHWSAVKRILHYLKHSITHGLVIRRSSSSQLTAYSDADWAGCPDDRKSTSGYCVFFGQNLISWCSKKQPTVSRSSTESEYKAIANAAAELTWIQSLLSELGVFLSMPPILLCDNIGATYLTANPLFHARTKHIAIDYHFVRDKVAAKTLVVKFLSSKDQIADILTKPLVSTRFQK
jgi:hypothetical protein